MPGPKAILLLARELDSGGSERQLTEIAKALDRSQWAPHVGCFHDTGIRAAELRSAGIPVFRFNVRSFRSASAIQALLEFRNYVRRHQILLTHSFDAPMNLFGVLAARLARCPVVLASQRSHRTLRSLNERRLLRISDKFVDGVVVNCEAVRRHLIADEGFADSSIHICYNGLDAQTFAPASVARPAGLEDAELVIGTLCVLRPEKGLKLLVDAFAAVQKLHPRIKLLIVGSGPMQDVIDQQARQLGISSRLYMQPATADVPAWLNMMDIFVLPSLSEALSNSLMEAMACGACAIASDVGGNPELVREGETGLLFRSGEASSLAQTLRRAIEDEPLRQRLAQAGSAFIRNRMTIEASVRRMQEIYSAALENQGLNGSRSRPLLQR